MDAEIAAALRAPFPAELVGKRPQSTCNKCKNSPSKVCDDHRKVRCPDCHQWMTTAHTHLDFIGHADTTDRFLQVDSDWSWEPFAVDERGLPVFDQHGGMWIRLTIAGVTRIGYGDAGGKPGANAIKEAIGDALRNAGMRFGVALDMWRKETPETEATQAPARQRTDRDWFAGIQRRIAAAESEQELLTLSNEIDAKVHAGGCTQGHYQQLRSLGRHHLEALAAAATPPPDVHVPEQAAAPDSADAGSEPGPVEKFETAIAAARTPEELGSVKDKVMDAFKAQEFDPTDGNRLLKTIKTRQTAIEAATP